jgi:hypothetical protein
MDKTYPEHDKLRALNGANDDVAEFLDFLESSGHTSYLSDSTKAHIVNEFFDIDADALQFEKDAMLQDLRAKREEARKLVAESEARQSREAIQAAYDSRWAF